MKSLLFTILCCVFIIAAAASDLCIVFPDDECVLDVKRDFGAKGDGKTDGTDALQGALDAKRSLMVKEERFPIASGDRVHYCPRVETISETESRYSAKIWPDGAKEPDDWQMQAAGPCEANPAGSVVFVAHHSDVTLCRVQVKSIDSELVFKP